MYTSSHTISDYSNIFYVLILFELLKELFIYKRVICILKVIAVLIVIDFFPVRNWFYAKKPFAVPAFLKIYYVRNFISRYLERHINHKSFKIERFYISAMKRKTRCLFIILQKLTHKAAS